MSGDNVSGGGAQTPETPPTGLQFGGTMAQTGMPMIDMVMMVMQMLGLGGLGDVAPRAGRGESVLDSYNHRARTMATMNIMNEAIRHNLITDKLGGQMGNQMAAMGGLADMISGGAISRGMAPFVGGYPGQGLMSMFQRMTGVNMAFTGQTGPSTQDQIMQSWGSFLRSGNYYRLGANGAAEAIDFNKSRGFEVQELMGAYTNATSMGLFNSRRSGIAGGLTAFTKQPQIAALESVRSMGWDMNDLNRMLGPSEDLLSTEGGANKLENLVRKVHAAARTAGITMKAMTDIIKQGQDLANMSPSFDYVSGEGIMDMSANATTRSMAMAGGLSGLEYRRKGGISGIISSMQKGFIQAGSEPGVQRITALYEQIAAGGGDTASIENYIRNGDMSPRGEAHFISQYGLNSGMGVSINSLVNSSIMGKLGLARLSADPKKRDLIERLAYGQYQASWDDWMNRDPNTRGAANQQRFYDIMDAEGGGIGGLNAAAAKMQMNPHNAEALRHMFLQGGDALEHSLMNQHVAGYAERSKAMDDARQAAAEKDKFYSDRLGRLYTPSMRQIIQGIIGGELQDKGALQMIQDIITNHADGANAEERRINQVVRGGAQAYMAAAQLGNGSIGMLAAFKTIGAALPGSGYENIGQKQLDQLQGVVNRVGDPAILGMTSLEQADYIANLEKNGEHDRAARIRETVRSPAYKDAMGTLNRIIGPDKSAYMRRMSGASPKLFQQFLNELAGPATARQIHPEMLQAYENTVNAGLSSQLDAYVKETNKAGTSLDMGDYETEEGGWNIQKLRDDANLNRGVFAEEKDPRKKKHQDKLRHTVEGLAKEHDSKMSEIEKSYGQISSAVDQAAMTKELTAALTSLHPLCDGLKGLVEAISGVAQGLGVAGTGSTQAGQLTVPAAAKG